MSSRLAAEALKRSKSETGEGYVTSQTNRFEELSDEYRRCDQICHNGKQGSQSCYVVKIRKKHLRESPSVLLDIANLGFQYQLGRLHAVGARIVASLALGTVGYPLIYSFNAVKPEPFCVRSCLLWPGVFRVSFERRAVFHTDSTSDAVFEAPLHLMYLSVCFAAATPVDIAMP